MSAHERCATGNEEAVAVLAQIDEVTAFRQLARHRHHVLHELAGRDRPPVRPEHGPLRIRGAQQRQFHAAPCFQRLNTSDVLTPPNAKLLLTTCSVSMARPSPTM